MDRGDNARQDRQEPEPIAVTDRRRIQLTQSDLEHWNKMPPAERFQDSAYQRWAQSFRSKESLSAAGKAGYNATVSRYGREYLHDRIANRRRERDVPYSRIERRTMRMLEELGEREDRSEYGGTRGSYLREYKLAPGRHADFAWPEKHKAIEAWGGVHTSEFFVRQQKVQEANRQQVDRARAAGWQLMILTADDLRSENWDETRERVRGFLA